MGPGPHPAAPPSNDRFVLLDRIGGGANGEVWRARAHDGSLVAIKLMAGLGVTKEAQLRFFREQALRFDSPNVAGPRGVTAFGSTPGLVMDLVDGRDLQALADTNHGRLPDPVLAAIAHDLLKAVAHLHDLGVIHRDIAPGNVLVRPDPHLGLVALLGDFGSALDLNGPRLTSTPGVVGTYGFSAPELFHGDDADERSDLFSLGATLRHVRPTPPIDEDPALSALLDALGATDPVARPGDAQRALALLGPRPTDRTLAACAGAGPDRVDVPTLPPEPHRPGTATRTRRRALVLGVVAGVAAAAVAVAAATFLAANDGNPTANDGNPTATPLPWQQQISDETLSGYDSVVALDRAGRPVVAHTDFRRGRLLVTTCGDPACSPDGRRTEVADPRRRSGYYPSIVLDGDDRPVIAYQDSTRGQLLLRRCADRSCADPGRVEQVPIPDPLSALVRQANTRVNPTAGSVARALQPQLVRSGDRLTLAYLDADAGRVRLLTGTCTSSCRWQERPVSPPATPAIGPDPAFVNNATLGLLPDGRPVLAATAGAFARLGQVWLAVCDDPACTRVQRADLGVMAFIGLSLAPTPTGITVAVEYGELGQGDPIPRLAFVDVPIAACPDPKPACPAIGSPTVTDLASFDLSWTAPDIAWDGRRLVVAFQRAGRAGPSLGLMVRGDDRRWRTAAANDVVPAGQRRNDTGHDPSIAVAPDGTIYVSQSRLPPAGGGQSAGSLWMFATGRDLPTTPVP